MTLPATRIGVAGFGNWGTKHVRVLTRIPEVDVSIIEVDESRRRRARSCYPGVTVVDDLNCVLGRLDGIVVATPPGTHARLAITTLQAGVHALVEKPLAMSEQDAAAAVEAARAGGASLIAGHTFEYNPAVWKLKELVSAGDLGRILHIDCARLNLGQYQQDCNVIWDLAPHDISIITYLLDELPATVSAWTHHAADTRNADIAHLRLDFPASGVPAFIKVSWFAPEKVRRIVVVGDRKTAVYDDLDVNGRVRVYDMSVHANDAGVLTTHRGDEVAVPSISFVEPLLVQDTHFVECVRGNAVPATPGERGLAVVRVLEAADDAIRTGRCAAVYRPSEADAQRMSVGVAS